MLRKRSSIVISRARGLSPTLRCDTLTIRRPLSSRRQPYSPCLTACSAHRHLHRAKPEDGHVQSGPARRVIIGTTTIRHHLSRDTYGTCEYTSASTHLQVPTYLSACCQGQTGSCHQHSSTWNIGLIQLIRAQATTSIDIRRRDNHRIRLHREPPNPRDPAPLNSISIHPSYLGILAVPTYLGSAWSSIIALP